MRILSVYRVTTGSAGSLIVVSIEITPNDQCNEVRVRTSCSDKWIIAEPALEYVAVSGPFRSYYSDEPWQPSPIRYVAYLPNQLDCPCESNIDVVVQCVGDAAQLVGELSEKRHLSCEDLCSLQIDYAFAGVQGDPMLPCLTPGASLPVLFRGRSSSGAILPGVHTWSISFADGTVIKKELKDPIVDASANTLEWPFTAVGSYVVTLTVAVEGCSAPVIVATKRIDVETCCPRLVHSLRWVGVPDSDCVGRLEVTLLNHPPVSTGFDWDFGDGSASETTAEPMSPVHGYTNGYFLASVVVRTPGCPDASDSAGIAIAGCRTAWKLESSDWLCVLLLMGVLVIWLASLVLAIVYACTQPAAAVLIVIAGVFATFGLLGLFGAACGYLTNFCRLLKDFRDAVVALAWVDAVVAVIIGAVGLVGSLLGSGTANFSCFTGLTGVASSIFFIWLIEALARRHGCLTPGKWNT